VGAGISAAGLALTRPDGLVYLAAFPGVIALRLLNDRSSWRNDARSLAVFSAASILPVLGYYCFRVVYFGDFYPNTYHVKGGPSLQDAVGFLVLSREQIIKTYDLFYGMFSWRAGLFIILLILGTFHLLSTLRRSSAVVFLLPAAACAWAAYNLLPCDWMGEFRFATPFFVILPLLMVALLAELLVKTSFSAGVKKMIFVIVLSLLVVHSSKVYFQRSIRFAEEPTVSFRGVAERYGLTFNYYADELGILDASILCPDLGGTLYYSKHKVYDLAGLCDRKIAAIIASRDNSKLLDHVYDLRPTFIHLHDALAMYSGLNTSDTFKRLYVPIVETPSKWAAEQGRNDVVSGDYVLRDACRPERLEKLKHVLQGKAPMKSVLDAQEARPFPRG
jgi:hypothetical protein